jgi:RNA polymerase sigma-70 factor (ECF subfamily)
VTTFQQFYTAHKERLFGYLLRKTGNYSLAADIMQESFTRCLERYRDREQTPALLFTIARNLLFDHSRKNRFDTPYEEEQHGLAVDRENEYFIKEEYRRVLQAMQRLGEEEQDIMALVVSSGLTYREIADITGNSEANIKVKIHRSRLKLKKIMRQSTL